MTLRDRLLAALSWRWDIRLRVLFARDMTCSAPPDAPELELRVLDRAGVLALARTGGMDLGEALAQVAMGLPGGCTAAFRGGELVGYAWWALEAAPDRRGLWVHVPPRAAYHYKAFVRPDCRNLGIVRQLYRFNDRLAVERGCRTALSLMALQNGASIRSGKAIGSTVVGWVLTFPLWGRMRAFHSPGARQSGLRVSLERAGGVPADAAFTRL